MNSNDNFLTAAGCKSWGVMLFEMIVGMTPFYDGTQDQVKYLQYVSFDTDFDKKHTIQFLSITTRTDEAIQEHRKVQNGFPARRGYHVHIRHGFDQKNVDGQPSR
jgi:hypothetical protein